MMQRKMLVAANWKMNGDHALAENMGQAVAGFHADNVDVVLCPPVILLHKLSSRGQASLGAQDMSVHDSGAYTGEISATMLKSADVDFVIVGHSERREYHQESNAFVAEKVAQVLKSGLTPVFCIGEPLDVREQGGLFEFLKEQLDAVLNLSGIEAFGSLVIAYEPIWAIGTGVTASKEQAQEVHAFIRNYLAEKDQTIAANCQILYGGSVNEKNAKELFSQPDIDGALVGGASLKTDSFLAICNAAAG